MQRGLRVLANKEEMWTGFLELELEFVAKVVERRRELGVERLERRGRSAAWREAAAAATEEEEGDEEDDGDGEVDPAIIARAVLKNGLEAMPGSLALRRELLALITRWCEDGHEFAEDLEAELLDEIESAFDQDAGADALLIMNVADPAERRHLFQAAVEGSGFAPAHLLAFATYLEHEKDWPLLAATLNAPQAAAAAGGHAVLLGLRALANAEAGAVGDAAAALDGAADGVVEGDAALAFLRLQLAVALNAGVDEWAAVCTKHDAFATERLLFGHKLVRKTAPASKATQAELDVLDAARVSSARDLAAIDAVLQRPRAAVWLVLRCAKVAEEAGVGAAVVERVLRTATQRFPDEAAAWETLAAFEGARGKHAAANRARWHANALKA